MAAREKNDMLKWVRKGLQASVKTTGYPHTRESAPGISPGRPAAMLCDGPQEAAAVAGLCPTGALSNQENMIRVDHRRCVHCGRCRQDHEHAMAWEGGYEWAGGRKAPGEMAAAFSRSLHIRILDAGACGACLSEIKQISSPYYNIHRLGFFITPTPRTADVLLVAGPLTDPMRLPLERCYAAMPDPKRVVAVGACAVSGGIFGPSFAAAAGISQCVPVDIEIPGCPPPPLALLHALLMVAGKTKQT